MAKDDGLYKETGGWGFERFDSKNARLAEKDRAQCYACHSKQKDRDLVFSTLRAADTGTPYPEGYRHWHFLHSSMVPATFDAFGEEALRKAVYGGAVSLLCERQSDGGLAHGLICRRSDHCRRDAGVAFHCKRREGGAAPGDWCDGERQPALRLDGGLGMHGNFDDGSRADKLDAKQREACHQCTLRAEKTKATYSRNTASDSSIGTD